MAGAVGTRVFVQASGRRVAPFDDAVGDCWIANRPLASWQAEAFAEARLIVVTSEQAPCLVVPDTLFTTGPALAAFVRGAAGRNAVLGLRASVFGARSVAVQPDVTAVEGGWRFEAVRFCSGGDEVPAVVWIDPEEEVLEIPLPTAFRDGDGPARVALPRHPVITIHHWIHLLWANQAAGASIARRTPMWRGLLKVLWAVLRAGSLRRWRVLAKLNTIGPGCDIHPTAVVEGSTLGRGVTVGAFARVLFSTLGDGATVMAGAHVEASTIGPGATLAQMTAMRLCVLYPEAFHGQGMLQASVLGRGTLTTMASYFIDLNFERNIRVVLDGTLHDTGTRFLGSAIGHGCRVGTGVWLAPGRALPNGTVWFRDPREVVAKVPERGDAGPFVTEGGALVPWRPPGAGE